MKIEQVLLLLLITIYMNAQVNKPNLYFFVDSNSVSLTGRWIPADTNEKAAFPSETEIDCDRNSATCVEATAEYYSGHPHVSLTFFKILRWNSKQIIASTSDSICMMQTITVSFPDKSATQTHSIKKLPIDEKQACEDFGASGTQIDLFIIKNSLRWNSDPYGESIKKY